MLQTAELTKTGREMVKITTKKGLILIIFLITLLAVGATAIQAQENSEDVTLEEIETPTELEDMINKFSRLDYNVVVHSEGEKIQDSLISYQYQGVEEVQGVDTDILLFEMHGEERQFSSIKVWLDGDDVKQMEIDGEIIPQQMAEMMKDTALRSVMFPFYQFADFRIEEFETMGDVSIREEVLAGQEVTIVRINVQELPEYELERGVMELAEFEEFMMVISYDYTSSEQDLEVKFSVEEIEFR